MHVHIYMHARMHVRARVCESDCLFSQSIPSPLSSLTSHAKYPGETVIISDNISFADLFHRKESSLSISLTDSHV